MLATFRAVAAAAFDLQPATHVSPSGQWELFVDPADRSGLGSSACRMTLEGAEVWAAELPFTFERAVVDDRGVAAGCGYSGTPPYGRDREFFVALLTARGELAYEERVALQASRFPHTDSDPKVAGVLLQPELGRFVVRVKDPDVNRSSESWWTYDLAAAALLGKPEPKQRMEDVAGLLDCLVARAVPGTPLVLSQWYACAWPSLGTRFVLADPQLDEVWSADLPTDYALPDDRDTENARLRRIWAEGTVLSVAERRFELHFVAEGQRVTFGVEPDALAPRGWSVCELSRSPHAFAPIEETAVALPEVELRSLGKARLQTGAGEAPAIRDVVEFDVAADGSMRFIRSEKEGLTQVHMDSRGGVLEEVSLDLPSDPASTEWAPLPDGDWLLARCAFDDLETVTVGRVAARTGRFVPFESLAGRRVEALAVGAARAGLLGPSGGELTIVDLEGRELWSAGFYLRATPDQLCSPEDVAVGADGRVAVVDNLEDVVQVFGPAGDFEQRFALDELFPEGASYPIGIGPDLDGGWLIHDFNESTAIWRLSAAGEVLAGFVPRFADGSTADALPRMLRREADGNLWTTDRASLLRLDEQGVVIEVVGAAPDREVLTQAGSAHLDHLGRVLVQDRRTGAVHMFDRSGRRLAVAALAPEEVDRIATWSAHFAVRDDGGFCVGLKLSQGAVEFGPDAARLGPLEPPLSAIALAVACDGSLCLWSAAEGDPGRRLSWYDAEGELQGTMTLPAGVPGSTRRDPVLGRGWVALTNYDSELVLVDLQDGSLRRVALVGDEEDVAWDYGASPDGLELWALEKGAGSLTLHRFAVQ